MSEYVINVRNEKEPEKELDKLLIPHEIYDLTINIVLCNSTTMPMLLRVCPGCNQYMTIHNNNIGCLSTVDVYTTPCI